MAFSSARLPIASQSFDIETSALALPISATSVVQALLDNDDDSTRLNEIDRRRYIVLHLWIVGVGQSCTVGGSCDQFEPVRHIQRLLISCWHLAGEYTVAFGRRVLLRLGVFLARRPRFLHFRNAPTSHIAFTFSFGFVCPISKTLRFIPVPFSHVSTSEFRRSTNDC